MPDLNNTRLVLPDPLWIVADDTLGELSWALRSSPFTHLALGMGLVEELRAIRRPVSNWQLGKVLRLESESFNYGYWHGQAPITYLDVTRSNYTQWAVEHPERARRLAE